LVVERTPLVGEAVDEDRVVVGELGQSFGSCLLFGFDGVGVAAEVEGVEVVEQGFRLGVVGASTARVGAAVVDAWVVDEFVADVLGQEPAVVVVGLVSGLPFFGFADFAAPDAVAVAGGAFLGAGLVDGDLRCGGDLSLLFSEVKRALDGDDSFGVACCPGGPAGGFEFLTACRGGGERSGGLIPFEGAEGGGLVPGAGVGSAALAAFTDGLAHGSVGPSDVW